ncbi:hypothetical protein [Okeania sp. SIO2B3]|nr:hypothetical protein [Okeania sp. SIO2B3]
MGRWADGRMGRWADGDPPLLPGGEYRERFGNGAQMEHFFIPN